MKKLILILLAISLLAALGLPALAFDSNVLAAPSYELAQNGFLYKEASVTEGSATRKLFYGEFNATASDSKYEWVLHSVSNGTDTTLSTVMDIATDYENTTGRKVMFATNGDFFYATGANVESYVNNGIVITKGVFATKHCIGFDNQGKVAIGRMTEVAVNLRIVTETGQTLLAIDKFNEEPSGDEIAIYNKPGSYTIPGANKIIVRAKSANLTNYPVLGSSSNMNSWSTLNDNEITLKSGQFAIVTKGKHAEFLQENKYGVQMDLVEVPAGDFAGCTWVVGGYDILVNDGVVGTGFHTDNSGNANRARTLIGIKEDGTTFLCVVDEKGGSTGITVTKEAELAKALGAKYALELDGGGSSTSIVRIDDQLTLRNSPSDGGMRRVSNAILLVEKDNSKAEAENLTAFQAAWQAAKDAPANEKFAALQLAMEKYNLLTDSQKTPYTDELQSQIDAYNQKVEAANAQHMTQNNLVAGLFASVAAAAACAAVPSKGGRL